MCRPPTTATIRDKGGGEGRRKGEGKVEGKKERENDLVIRQFQLLLRTNERGEKREKGRERREERGERREGE